MIRFCAAALTAAALLAAPQAVADPEILVPGCEGQAPQAGACTAEPEVISPEGPQPLVGFFEGANPNLPLGPTPLNFPVVLPLGVTPFNVPSNLPLGPTPPTRLPFAPP